MAWLCELAAPHRDSASAAAMLPSSDLCWVTLGRANKAEKKRRNGHEEIEPRSDRES